MSSQHFVAVGPDGRKIGIVSSTYDAFVRKCKKKFNLKGKNIYVALDDDTEVDEEYFEILKSETVLSIRIREKSSAVSYHQLAEFLHQCLLKQPKIHDQVTDYLRQPEKASVVLGLLAQVAESSCSPSRKEDDLEWFKGLNTKFRTKEAVMKNSAETRMRGYLEQAKKQLRGEENQLNPSYRHAVDFFKEQLSIARYNGNYFDRSADAGDRLCDANGVFLCEGLYNQPDCKAIHTINPYNSREARIVFSTWNLDHVIEKSRSILPVLKTALEGPRSSAVNLPYFHELLFIHQCQNDEVVHGNLKLVHIACHDKKPHDAQCSSSRVYVKQGKAVREHGGLTELTNDTIDGCTKLQTSAISGVITRQRSLNLRNFGTLEDVHRFTIKTQVKRKKASQDMTIKPKRPRFVS